MKMLLVRHGETVLNARGRHQYPDTKLSKLGIKQAELLGLRLSSVRPDIIICSRLPRAVQTAKIISKATKSRIVYSNILYEFKRPSMLHGKPYNSPFSERIKASIIESVSDPEYHYSDEENYTELRKRAAKALSLLMRRKEKYVLVVTHGNMIGMMLSVMLIGMDVPITLSVSLARKFYISNTGITECEVGNDGKISLVTVNDFTHLK
ncbi:MAG: histidine phosphatase family protein [Candidatus Marsarchaeota archaeon]|nr:histidine phosphatase family protein [Candidatus Marsarchaeota archaeon]